MPLGINESYTAANNNKPPLLHYPTYPLVISSFSLGQRTFEREKGSSITAPASSSSISLNKSLYTGVSSMDDCPRGLKVFSDHFEASTSGVDSHQAKIPSGSRPTTDDTLRSQSRSCTRRKSFSAASMLNFFSLRGLPWGSGTDSQEKVVLTAAEVESLRSGLADLEEREAYLKARLEHVDEILRSARFSGYLYVRTRWTALPGEPPPIDDTEVDDWLPRFLVLHGSCIFYYLFSTDLSPQDSTLLSDITEVGRLPCFTQEDEETRYCFYILTRHGLRCECSSVSKQQVDSWLMVLQNEVNSLNDSRK